MRIVHNINDIREFVAQARKDGKTIGLVPTMGYFHDGHLSLMRRAKEDNDLVFVSLFVNPTQFGPSEDFRQYPRDLDRDSRMAEGIGVDVIFNPSVDEMYPDGCQAYVDVEKLNQRLCGASRPGHFRGVATVVMKLFNIIQADKAYFGQKDYQQLKVIERMVKDLNVPIKIIGMPIIRESDGLAMSSRNTYLNPEEHKAALVLSKSLAYAQNLISEGITSGSEIQRRVEEFIAKEPLAQIDYAAVVDPDNLDCVVEIQNQVVLALAVRIGNTRLIDNVLLSKS